MYTILQKKNQILKKKKKVRKIKSWIFQGTETSHLTWKKTIQDLGECPASDPDAEELSLSESATNIVFVRTTRYRVHPKNYNTQK